MLLKPELSKIEQEYIYHPDVKEIYQLRNRPNEWWFYDEGYYEYGPYVSFEEAHEALKYYINTELRSI